MDYLIQGELATAMANQVRRIAETDNLYSVAHVAEILQQINGNIADVSGEYSIQAMDYDGNVIKQKNLDSGMVFTFPELDSPAEGYVTKWRSSDTPIYNNYLIVADGDASVYPSCNTESGASEFITVSTDTLTPINKVRLPTNVTDDDVWKDDIIVDWGDGVIDNNREHTYEQSGVYTVKVYGLDNVSSGCADCWSSVKIDNGVIKIGHQLFGSQTGSSEKNIISVTIPESVEEIEMYAFAAPNLRYVNIIGEGLTTIGQYVFKSSAIENINLPNSVTSMSHGVFSYCTKLQSVTIPNKMTEIPASTFEGCTSLQSVAMPDGVIKINNKAFYNCSKLSDITLPKNLTLIGENAFYNCDGLISVTIPDAVTNIGNYAFHHCTNLSSIVIPNSVTSIGEKAFYYCNNLTSAIYQGTAEEWADVTVGSYNSSLTNVITFAG